MGTANAFKRLYIDQDFADVTLATKDGAQIKAHRNILASVSPFFKTLLLANPHAHPLLYLKGVKNSSLKFIIKFIYLGQVEIYKADLDDFMNAAEELEISGLYKSDVNESRFVERQEHVIEPFTQSFIIGQTTDNSLKTESFDNLESSSSTQLVTEDYHDEELLYPVQSNLDLYSCTQCEFTTKQRYNLKSHIAYKHEGIRYECSYCQYKATTTSHLRRHVTKQHGV